MGCKDSPQRFASTGNIRKAYEFWRFRICRIFRYYVVVCVNRLNLFLDLEYCLFALIIFRENFHDPFIFFLKIICVTYDVFGSSEEGGDYRIFCTWWMVGIKVQALISMSWFSVNKYRYWSIVVPFEQSIQERKTSIIFLFDGKLNWNELEWKESYRYGTIGLV